MSQAVAKTTKGEVMEQQYKYLKIGAAWDGEYGISGILEGPLNLVDDKQKLKFYLFVNKKKVVGSKSPDYSVMIKNESFDGHTNEPIKKDEKLPF